MIFLDIKEKIRETRVPIAIAVLTIIFAIVAYSVLGNQPETFTAIATIALVTATIYIAYLNLKLWQAQDRPWLMFDVRCMDWAGGDRKCFMYVTNIGKGPAIEVTFRTLNKVFHYGSLTPGIGQLVEAVPFPLPPDGIQIRDISYADISQNRIQQDEQTIHK